MSLLPQQILSPSTPIGRANPDGSVIIDHNWWLLIYNLWLNTLGTGAGIPADALIDLESADLDASNADAISLRQGLANALSQAIQPAEVVVGVYDLPDLQRALLLSQEATLADPTPRAPPAQSVAIGASPFTYTAAFDGTVVLTGGTVSAIALVRQGTSIATGITAGLFPLSRLDQLQITYSAAPTMTFLPR